MEQALNTTSSSSRVRSLRASGQRRKLALIEAALRVTSRDGLRAVSHRSVAAEAGVPLAATTYYFADLDELITESFLHHSQRVRNQVADQHALSLDALCRERDAGGDAAAMVALIAGIGADFVIQQVRTDYADRVLEFAFMHEAARVPSLRAAVELQRRDFITFLADIHRALGATQAELNAEISYSILIGMEKALVLAGEQPQERERVRAVFEHHLRSILAHC